MNKFKTYINTGIVTNVIANLGLKLGSVAYLSYNFLEDELSLEKAAISGCVYLVGRELERVSKNFLRGAIKIRDLSDVIWS